MGQSEVLQCLKQEKKPMSVLDVANAIKTNPESVRRSLNQMHKYGEILMIEGLHPTQWRTVRYWKIKSEGGKPKR